MPPKKDPKGKEAAAPKEIILGEYELSQCSLPELQGFVLRLQDEVEKARDSRNFFQVERDRIEQYWESSKRELEEADAKIEDFEKQIEDLAKKLEEKLTFGDEEMKYFEFERERRLREKKEAADVRRQQAIDVLQKEKEEHFEEHRKKTEELNHERKILEETVEQTVQRDREFLRRTAEEKQEELQRTIRSFEEMCDSINAQLQLLKDVQLHEFREKQSEQQREFFDSHFKNTDEMKSYFKDIIGRSLMLIDAIRDEIDRIREAEEAMRETRLELARENEDLSRVAKKARSLRIQQAHYEQDKASDAFTRKRIREYVRRIQELETANEDLAERFGEVTTAKGDLEVQFVSTLKTIQDGLDVKNRVAQAKIDDLLNALEEVGVNTASLRLPAVDNTDCLDLKTT